MCDFDLSQALESPLDLDGTGHHEGVATLVVAANRLKKSLSGSRDLRNSDLCRVIMDNLVDETLVQTVADVTTGQRRLIYQNHQSRECTLSDTHKRTSSAAQTISGCRPSRSEAETATTKTGAAPLRWRWVCSTSTDLRSVHQSPREHKRYLSCRMNDDSVELHLEEFSDECVMQSIDDPERFFFYKRVEGVSLSCFESFLYPGWFISTSETENQPVEMCRVDSAQRVTRFNVTY
ncbi:hypothetical protein INR49_007291 [Caranx melampygus]|nr:hypothetical protein INR49_007291 [Caranx melampygus]